MAEDKNTKAEEAEEAVESEDFTKTTPLSKVDDKDVDVADAPEAAESSDDEDAAMTTPLTKKDEQDEDAEAADEDESAADDKADDEDSAKTTPLKKKDDKAMRKGFGRGRDKGADKKADDAASKSSSRKGDSKPAAKKASRPAAKKPSSSRKAAAKLGGTVSTTAAGLLAAVLLVLGLVLGYFAVPKIVSLFSGSTGGKTTVTEAELDSPLGTYTYAGQTYTVTVRDVITQTSTLEQAKNKDGSYNIPSADYVVSIARMQILLKEAERQGIKPTDEEITKFAQDTLGSADFAAVAESYGMSEEDVRTMITEYATRMKLLEANVKTTKLEAPIAPDQNQDAATYHDYIIKLAGKNWDSEKNTWKDAEGDWATTMASYDISAEGATYDAATAAYYVAYNEYSQAQNEISQKQTAYVNGLFANCTVTLDTLVAQ